MSTHPNVILMAVLTPKGLARQTMAAILGKPYVRDHHDVEIGGEDYHTLVMEEDYDDGMQISAKEGDLVFYDLVTYGYGEVIAWADLEARKAKLEEWAKNAAQIHACDWRIEVSANYW